MDEPAPRSERPLGALRDVLGPRFYRMLDKAINARVEREVRARLADEVARALDARLPEIEARAAAAARRADLDELVVYGPPDRLIVAATAIVNDALLNTMSGTITIGEHAFFGHGVRVLTGTHDVSRRGLERQGAIAGSGHDIVIDEGAWIGTGAIVLGPCRVGAHAVVAAGAVVARDVQPETLVAGVPARLVREL
ncbi:MAG TPA: hypothetical protein VMY78_14345 [Solirubrobacteraceae bacterium]|nr:hypothetical protein [Solirubrobacteraceae bacterium]